MQYRTLGKTDIQISSISLGCWPIAGITSPGSTTHEDSLATIRACFDLGINHLDTAYFYGRDGESERLIAEALGTRRNEMVIATKCGIHWSEDGMQTRDGRPETLRRHVDQSLQRLQTDRVELLYLHAPDPNVPIAESAGELKRLMEEGKTRAVGVSNVEFPELKAFAAECPTAAFQPLYNILQRQIERDTLPWCLENGVAVLAYRPLLKGLLAGKIARDHVFDKADSRSRYEMFRGDQWEQNHDFVDRLRDVARSAGKTVAQVVINWTIRQPGITCAICGARRPDQIIETVGGEGWELSDEERAMIDQAIEDRGDPVEEPAFTPRKINTDE